MFQSRPKTSEIEGASMHLKPSLQCLPGLGLNQKLGCITNSEMLFFV